MKNWIIKTYLMATYTIVELIKSKVMMSVVIIGGAIGLISFVAAQFTFGVPEKVALDFGMGCLSLAAVGIGIFMGSSLIFNEIENRTLYMVLSRKVGRTSFVTGKLIGISAIIIMTVLLLGIITYGMYIFLGGKFSSLILWCLLFSCLEAILIMLVVVFLSLVTNLTMTVIYGITIYIIGHALTATLAIKFIADKVWLQGILKVASIAFPNFSKLSIRPYLVYQQDLSLDFLVGAFSYGFLYCLVLYAVINYLFWQKNLD